MGANGSNLNKRSASGSTYVGQPPNNVTKHKVSGGDKKGLKLKNVNRKQSLVTVGGKKRSGVARVRSARGNGGRVSSRQEFGIHVPAQDVLRSRITSRRVEMGVENDDFYDELD